MMKNDMTDEKMQQVILFRNRGMSNRKYWCHEHYVADYFGGK
ncbi:MAG: hypothetical protein SOT60_12505 [Bilifractor sp.]|nr:hypothetical protein [Bilifractor sp.]